MWRTYDYKLYVKHEQCENFKNVEEATCEKFPHIKLKHI